MQNNEQSNGHTQRPEYDVAHVDLLMGKTVDSVMPQ